MVVFFSNCQFWCFWAGSSHGVVLCGAWSTSVCPSASTSPPPPHHQRCQLQTAIHLGVMPTPPPPPPHIPTFPPFQLWSEGEFAWLRQMGWFFVACKEGVELSLSGLLYYSVSLWRWTQALPTQPTTCSQIGASVGSEKMSSRVWGICILWWEARGNTARYNSLLA